jgi:hypothetical protein
MLNIKQCKKVNHSKDTFWYNFIVTDLLKIEPLLRIKRWRGGVVINFLHEGEGVLKIKVFSLGRL